MHEERESMENNDRIQNRLGDSPNSTHNILPPPGSRKNGWAILLCQFSNESAPFDRQHYDKLFTVSGQGTLNMVQFFEDMSHGAIDISGSQTFGTFTLNIASDTKLSGDDLYSALLSEAVSIATTATSEWEIPFVRPDWFNVVVCVNAVPSNTGGCTWGSPAGVTCDSAGITPAVLGQEMGHGYGLRHSKIDGSEAEYMDPWDVMSTMTAWSAFDPDYTSVGPGLNAANMDGRGWLDESRVWSPGVGSTGLIELRPLHRRDLPGLLAARVGQFIVEFRVVDKWDAGIGGSGPRGFVFVHRFSDGTSYLMADKAGTVTLQPGDVFESPSPRLPGRPYERIEVLGIDTTARTAQLRVRFELPAQPPSLFGQILGEASDGDFRIYYPGGKVVHVPPRSPTRAILERIAEYQAAAELRSAFRDDIKREALRDVARLAMSEHEQLSATGDRPSGGTEAGARPTRA
jgi:hypothetical protein